MKRGEFIAKSVEMMTSRPWYKRFWLKLTGQKHLAQFLVITLDTGKVLERDVTQ